MFLYFYYYFTQKFLNEPARKAYLAFLIIYMVVTLLPRLIFITFEHTFDRYFRSCCQKILGYFFLLIVSMIHGEYLWLLFFYRFENMNYNYRDMLKNSTVFSRIAQMFVQVTMITILGVNEVDNLVKGLTIGFSGFQIAFNLITAICLGAR